MSKHVTITYLYEDYCFDLATWHVMQIPTFGPDDSFACTRAYNDITEAIKKVCGDDVHIVEQDSNTFHVFAAHCDIAKLYGRALKISKGDPYFDDNKCGFRRNVLHSRIMRKEVPYGIAEGTIEQ